MADIRKNFSAWDFADPDGERTAIVTWAAGQGILSEAEVAKAPKRQTAQQAAAEQQMRAMEEASARLRREREIMDREMMRWVSIRPPRPSDGMWPEIWSDPPRILTPEERAKQEAERKEREARQQREREEREAREKRMSGAGVRLPDATWCFIATARAWNAWATGQALAKISLKKNADGTWTVPDIIGGPPRGEGVDALDGVKLSPTAKRARAELEEDVGVTAP